MTGRKLSALPVTQSTPTLRGGTRCRGWCGPREKAGDRQIAERLAWYGANATGDVGILRVLAQLRQEAGAQQDAERLLRAAAAGAGAGAGDINVLWDLVEIHEKAGMWEEAERLALQAANAGHSLALTTLARIRHGLEEEYQRRGLASDGSLAEPWEWPQPALRPGPAQARAASGSMSDHSSSARSATGAAGPL